MTCPLCERDSRPPHALCSDHRPLAPRMLECFTRASDVVASGQPGDTLLYKAARELGELELYDDLFRVELAVAYPNPPPRHPYVAPDEPIVWREERLHRFHRAILFLRENM